MRELSHLKALAEAPVIPFSKEEGARKTSKFFNPLTDALDDVSNHVTDALEKLSMIEKQLQSAVITDLMKDGGFPATEANGAKKYAAEARAMAEELKSSVALAEEHILGLYQTLGMEFFDNDN